MSSLTLLAFLQALTSHTRSVDEAVGRLPPEMRARFVLMEHSLSLQDGTPAAPRAILYHPSGNLVVTFNGEPGQRGYSTLETLAYDPNRKSYELRRVDYSKGFPDISPANPPACLRCHRTLPRPNWEPYPYWPGALGSGLTYSSQEKDRLRAFASLHQKHPRYGHLLFADHEKLYEKISPALDLNHGFLHQAQERIPWLLSRSPDYRRFRYALAGALADCPDWEGAVPAGLLPGDIVGRRKELSRRFALLPEPHRRLLRPEAVDATAKLQYLLEGRGFPLDWLTHSFPDRLFLTADGFLLPYVLRSLGTLDPDLGPAPLAAVAAHFQGKATEEQKKAHGAYCSDLKRASRKALGSGS